MNLTNLFQTNLRGRGANADTILPDTAQPDTLRDAMQSAYAAPDVTPDLRRRVADLAVQHDQRRVMTPHSKSDLLWQTLRCLSVGAVCGCLVLGVLAWPRIHTSYLMYRMQRAIVDAPTLHAVTYSTANGSFNKTREVWHQGGGWRMEEWKKGKGSLFPKRIVTVEAPHRAGAKHQATDEARTSRIEGGAWIGGMSLTLPPRLAAQYGLWSRLEEMPQDYYNFMGRRTIKYAWQPAYYDRPHTFLWLDAQTHLPVRIVVEAESHGAWEPYTESVLDYNHLIEAAAFSNEGIVVAPRQKLAPH